MSLKQDWVNALTSGEYKQAQGCLRTEDAYCCLGVLADLNKNIIWEPVDDPDSFIHKFTAIDTVESVEHEGVYLGPNEVLKAVRPDSVGPVYIELAKMNDAGKTFKEIAEWIDENLNDDLTLKENNVPQNA